MTPTDFAHTPPAEASRRRKARALADAAAELGVSDEALSSDWGRRDAVLAAAGVKRASEATWFVVHELMSARPPPARTYSSD